MGSCDCPDYKWCTLQKCPGKPGSVWWDAGCAWEVFRISKRSSKGGPIYHYSSSVEFVGVHPCISDHSYKDYKYLTGKDKTWVQLTDYDGSCEAWDVRHA